MSEIEPLINDHQAVDQAHAAVRVTREAPFTAHTRLAHPNGAVDVPQEDAHTDLAHVHAKSSHVE